MDCSDILVGVTGGVVGHDLLSPALWWRVVGSLEVRVFTEQTLSTMARTWSSSRPPVEGPTTGHTFPVTPCPTDYPTRN